MLSGNPALPAVTRQSARKGETAAAATLRRSVGKSCWTLSHKVYPVRGHLPPLFSHGRWTAKLSRFWRVGILTFFTSIVFSLLSTGLLAWLDLFTSFLLLLVIVAVGILFDLIGVATTASREDPFHAMAVQRVPGAREASWLVRHQDQVASFTLDIVGDVVGTLSGAIGATIVFRLVTAYPGLNETILSTLLIAVIAALAVGGKAYAKTIAFERRTEIVLWSGRVLHVIGRVTGIRFAGGSRCGRGRKNGNARRGQSNNNGKRGRTS